MYIELMCVPMICSQFAYISVRLLSFKFAYMFHFAYNMYRFAYIWVWLRTAFKGQDWLIYFDWQHRVT